MFRIPTNSLILGQIARLDEFKGQWSRQGLSRERLARLREMAELQSVAASCRLAGIRVSDDEVSSLLRGEAPQLRDAADLLGYRGALRHRFPAGGELLTLRTLGQLHALLRGQAGPEVEPSPLRDTDLVREAFTAEGHATGRVFSTLPPRMLEHTLEELITWTELELREGTHHPVLVSGLFVLGLLAAGPYPTHNGRLARIVSGHLLQRAGYAHLPYASIEREIEPEREAYHDAFDKAQTQLWSGEAHVEPWLEFFLEILDRQRRRVTAKMELERVATDFPPLQRAILETVREHGTVGAGLLLAATHANRNTLKDNLRRMVERGVLEKTGQRRGTLYRLPAADPSP